MNAASELLRAGRDEAIALIIGKREVSYGELRAAVAGAVRGLRALGAAKADRIGLWAENGAFSVASYFGAMQAGMTAVPLPTESSRDSLLAIVRDTQMRVLLVSARYARQVREHLAGASIRVIAEGELPETDGEASAEPAAIDEARDLASLMFTSGSTGRPKGVMVTHRNVIANTRDIAAYMGFTPADRAMLVLPLHYCFGLSVLHSVLSAGGTVVLNNQFLFPESVLQDMQRTGCTGLAGVPSTFQILLRKSRFKSFPLPALRWLQQAGGRLANAYIDEIRNAFPSVRLFVMYGQTEATARLSYLPPERLAEKCGSIGRGLPSSHLEVLAPDERPVAPGSSEIGEIVASGDNICAGYWNDPAESQKFFREGRLFTGDLARVDAEGFIFIVDRERDMIKSGGNRVGAKEVEDVLAELPQVVESAVIGAPHELLGEAIRAFVVLAPGAALETAAILEHCRQRLPAFKVPELVELVDRLPHNSSGKVLKSQLRQLVLERSAAPAAAS